MDDQGGFRCTVPHARTKEAIAEVTMIDLMVQVAVALAVLAMLILLFMAGNRGSNQRERILKQATHRHWWSRTRNGH